jgi:hypothetical protein
LSERKFKYDRELQAHKRRAELAEVIVADFDKVSRVVVAIRNPLASQSEAKDRPRQDNETAEQSHQLDTYFTPIARMKSSQEFISSFLAKRYQASAVLGKRIDTAYSDVENVLNRTYVSALTFENGNSRSLRN